MKAAERNQEHDLRNTLNIHIHRIEHRYRVDHEFEGKIVNVAEIPVKEMQSIIEDSAMILEPGSGCTREFEAPNKQRELPDLKKIGTKIFDKLIHPPNSKSLYVIASEKRDKYLSIQFNIDQSLHQISFELANDGIDNLALNKTLISRTFRDRKQTDNNLEVENNKLNILLTMASPETAPRINTKKEIEDIENSLAVKNGSFNLSKDTQASITSLNNKTKKANASNIEFHVWIHGGHGHIKDNKFYLILCDHEDKRRSDYISIDRIKSLIAKNDKLKLAILNVCMAGIDKGLALELSRLEIPAIISYQTAVYDEHAIQFSSTILEYLKKYSVEESLYHTRVHLKTNEDPVAWARPILIRTTKYDSLLLKKIEKKQTEKDNGNTYISYTNNSSQKNNKGIATMINVNQGEQHGK